MRSSRILPLLLLALAVPAARAQPAPELRPERLYLNPTTLLGSSRQVAMGGAYVGIAEGAAGFTSNLSALAHRQPTLDTDWDIGSTLSWLNLVGNRKRRDVDNDGVADDSDGAGLVLGGVTLQYKTFGLGAFTRVRTQSYAALEGAAGGPSIDVTQQQTALAGAASFGDDDFMLGFGLYGAQATFDYMGEQWFYGGTGVALDFLFRPRGRPYRIGIAVRPEVEGHWRREGQQNGFVAGRQLFRGVVSPGVLSVGASWRLGRGRENYNNLSPAAMRQAHEDAERRERQAHEARARRRAPALAPPPVGASQPPPDASQPPPPDALPPPPAPKPRPPLFFFGRKERVEPPGRLLISAQLDLIGSASNAVSLGTFTAQQTEPTFVGGQSLVQPRVGVEHETLPGWLRTRLGTFIEPSPFPGRTARAHLTGGVELYLFHFWDDWSLNASFDVASRYKDIGLSVGVWR